MSEILNQYNEIKNNLNDLILFKLSQMGFALNCDLILTNRLLPLMKNEFINEVIKNIDNNSKIFIDLCSINIDIINNLVTIIKNKNIKVNFYIMFEPYINSDIIELLLPVSHNLFTNNNIYNHPKLHVMPIGIRDDEKIFNQHKGFNHKLLYNEGKKIINKQYLCLLCFTLNTELNRNNFGNNDNINRQNLYNLFKNKYYITNLMDNIYEKQEAEICGKVPVTINYEYTNKSYYVLCPYGYGIDTHRFWECIYLNTIPIVLKSNTAFDKIYNNCPCLIVNSWNDVTEKLLYTNLDKCYKQLYDFKSKYKNFFTDLNSISDLLLLF